MGGQHEDDLLRKVAQGLVQTLEALRVATPLQLEEAEVEIPFTGTPVSEKASPGLGDFRDVSMLTGDIGPSGAPDTWKVRILIAKDRAVVLKVEKYEAAAIS